jgi:hypothetical protein
LVSGLIIAACTPFAWSIDEVPEAPEGYVIVSEPVWLVFVVEFTDDFREAHAEFLDGDAAEAAASIQRAAGYVKTVSRRAVDKDVKKALKASRKELTNLAKDVKRDAVASPATLEAAFARAECALARHHYLKALDYEAKEKYEEAVYALEAAAAHLLNAAAWAYEDMDSEDAKTAKNSRSALKALKRGAMWAPSKIGEALKGLGRGIEKFGKKARVAPAPEYMGDDEQ